MLGKKLICSISGGVDSAVAALLLKRKGYEVCGIFMRNWDTLDEKGQCQADIDKFYAQRVCDSLDIPLTEIDLVKEYWTSVFQPMVERYEQGITPNPDILCNRSIKFDALHRKCEEVFDTEDFVVATGHYADTSAGEGVLSSHLHSDIKLLKAEDDNKDQTFFLHRVTSSALKRTYFPLANLHKKQVKEMAENSPISFTLERKESMGICFIGNRKFSDFIQNYIPPRPGNFVCLESGKVLKSHSGFFKYTVGQRTRVGLDQNPYAVLHRDVISGDVIVVPHPDHAALYSRSVLVENLHWITSLPTGLGETETLRCQFRLNHRYPLVDCALHLVASDDMTSRKALIVLDYPMRALTVGQAAVLYDGNVCLGGGVIVAVGPSLYETGDDVTDDDDVTFNWFRTDAHVWRHLMAEYGGDVAARGNPLARRKIEEFRHKMAVLNSPDTEKAKLKRAMRAPVT